MAHDYVGQGSRSDLTAVKVAILEGKSKKDLYNDHFESMVKYHAGIAKAINVLQPPKRVAGRYALDAFAAQPRGWERIPAESLRARLIVLTGPSGIGKTQFALAHFENPLFVSHMDQLGKLEGGDYDGIIFDDMSFSHLPREARIHLCDLEFDRQFHIRYTTALLPAGLPRILTTNKSIEEVLFKPDEDHKDKAILRRIHVIKLDVDEEDEIEEFDQ